MKQKYGNQRNINIIKSFFSNRLILLTGIFITLGSLTGLVSSAILATTPAFDNISNFSTKHIHTLDMSHIDLSVGILYILFYIFSKSKGDKIKTTFKIYAVYTKVNLILSAIYCILIPLLLFLGLVSNTFSIGYTIVYLLFAFPVFILTYLISTYIERRFANALYESATASLSTEGAKEYSVLCFISFGLSIFLQIILKLLTLSEFNLSYILLFLPAAVINCISMLLIGLVAKKYADAIPDEEYEEVVESEKENRFDKLTYPDLKTDTTEVCDQKYIHEIDVNINYEENLYDK